MLRTTTRRTWNICLALTHPCAAFWRQKRAWARDIASRSLARKLNTRSRRVNHVRHVDCVQRRLRAPESALIAARLSSPSFWRQKSALREQLRNLLFMLDGVYVCALCIATLLSECHVNLRDSQLVKTLLAPKTFERHAHAHDTTTGSMCSKLKPSKHVFGAKKARLTPSNTIYLRRNPCATA